MTKLLLPLALIVPALPLIAFAGLFYPASVAGSMARWLFGLAEA